MKQRLLDQLINEIESDSQRPLDDSKEYPSYYAPGYHEGLQELLTYLKTLTAEEISDKLRT